MYLIKNAIYWLLDIYVFSVLQKTASNYIRLNLSRQKHAKNFEVTPKTPTFIMRLEIM